MPPLPSEGEDESIVFPEFSGPAADGVNQPGSYDVDGATLQSLLTALNDFLPAESRDPSCWNRPDAWRYRVIRQGDTFFIRIQADPAFCAGKLMMLDSGAQYAISRDGRILRRLFTGQPDWTPGSETPDAGDDTGDAGRNMAPADADIADVLESTWSESRAWLDGGFKSSRPNPQHDGLGTSDGGSRRDGGVSPTPVK
ncbi:hypothetical protein [Hyalangium versicolor]|uniref:hypothetical protein n=1 Tax=Hyalangium versicolor TaxID=2861190 RepID=UPI001CCAB4DA|nr:hypothetical protein [Hyalangium versicolor]